MNQTSTESIPSAPLLLTIEEACKALRVSRWQLYQLINRRQLRTVRIDRRRLTAPEDLTALIQKLREQEGGDDGETS